MPRQMVKNWRELETLDGVFYFDKITGKFYLNGTTLEETVKEITANEVIANVTISETWLNGLTLENLYGKIVRSNGILYIVISGRLKNETENSISTYSPSAITDVFKIPEEIGSKIYRKDGTNITQSAVNGDNITGASIKISSASNGGIESKICNIYSSVANYISVYASDNTGSITVNAGGSRDFDMRVFLIL